MGFFVPAGLLAAARVLGPLAVKYGPTIAKATLGAGGTALAVGKIADSEAYDDERFADNDNVSTANDIVNKQTNPNVKQGKDNNNGQLNASGTVAGHSTPGQKFANLYNTQWNLPVGQKDEAFLGGDNLQRYIGGNFDNMETYSGQHFNAELNANPEFQKLDAREKARIRGIVLGDYIDYMGKLDENADLGGESIKAIRHSIDKNLNPASIDSDINGDPNGASLLDVATQDDEIVKGAASQVKEYKDPITGMVFDSQEDFESWKDDHPWQYSRAIEKPWRTRVGSLLNISGWERSPQEQWEYETENLGNKTWVKDENGEWKAVYGSYNTKTGVHTPTITAADQRRQAKEEKAEKERLSKLKEARTKALSELSKGLLGMSQDMMSGGDFEYKM